MLGSYPFSRKDGNKSLPPTVQTKNLLQQGKQKNRTTKDINDFKGRDKHRDN